MRRNVYKWVPTTTLLLYLGLVVRLIERNFI